MNETSTKVRDAFAEANAQALAHARERMAKVHAKGAEATAKQIAERDALDARHAPEPREIALRDELARVERADPDGRNPELAAWAGRMSADLRAMAELRAVERYRDQQDAARARAPRRRTLPRRFSSLADRVLVPVSSDTRHAGLTGEGNEVFVLDGVAFVSDAQWPEIKAAIERTWPDPKDARVRVLEGDDRWNPTKVLEAAGIHASLTETWFTNCVADTRYLVRLALQAEHGKLTGTEQFLSRADRPRGFAPLADTIWDAAATLARGSSGAGGMTEALRFWEAERVKQQAEEPTPAPVPTPAPTTSARVRPRLRASEVAEIRKLGTMADAQEADDTAEVHP